MCLATVTDCWVQWHNATYFHISVKNQKNLFNIFKHVYETCKETFYTSGTSCVAPPVALTYVILQKIRLQCATQWLQLNGPDIVIINKHLSSVSTEPQILIVRGETYRNFTQCVQKKTISFVSVMGLRRNTANCQTVIKSELHKNAVLNCTSLCWQQVIHELRGKKSTSDALREDVKGLSMFHGWHNHQTAS